MNDRERLQKALDALTDRGYETHARFWCCMSCGVAALAEDTTCYVFWHEQDDASAFGETGDSMGYRRGYEDEPEHIWQNYTKLRRALYLRWGGDAEEIQHVFQSQGFKTSWGGSQDQAIMILPK